MPRTKSNVASRKRRKKILKQASGYRGGRSKLIRTAKEAVDKGLKYAFSGRREKKRQYRRLWIIRINAAAREHGLNYNQLVHGLKLAQIELDRKVLAEIAVNDPANFAELAGKAKEQLS